MLESPLPPLAEDPRAAGEALPAAVRAGIAAAALVGALSDPPHATAALIIALAAALDLAAGLIRRSLRPRPAAALYRDGLYALGFYLAYLHNFRVPALLLWPVVVVEALVVQGPRVWPRLLAAGLAGLGLRVLMAWHGRPARYLGHPAWVAAVLLALAGAVWAGRNLWRQRELDATVAARRRQVREAMQLVIGRLLAANGIAREGAEAEGVPALLDAVCEQIGDRARCAEAADRLARLVEEEHLRRTLLTDREREILPWLATGLSYQTIAQRLVVSPGTVRAHAAAIMRKAGTHTRAETVEWARRLRLLEDDPVG
ncbi:MAG: LuxR C-terminal-related transcriptional regulator [Firmicutes bacterium]|nr:LuxR C-terminal-related transcriptional regulator [Bacillota bacterium]